MKTRLIIDDNTVYEIDEECLGRMNKENRCRCDNYMDREKCSKENNNRASDTGTDYKSRFY